MMVTTGPLIPVPVRGADSGVEPGVASVTVRAAVLGPAVVGLNATTIAQDAWASSGRKHLVSVMVNWSALRPEIAVLKVPEGDPPILPTLKVKVVAGVAPTPAETVALVGLMVRLGPATTVGVTATFCTVPPPLHAMFSFLSPAVVALKVNPYLQEALASMVPVQVVLAASAARSAPLARQERPVSGPVAVTVTVIDELSPTRAAVGTPEAATSNVPRVLPKPLRETVRPAFTVRVAFFAPTDVGVNTIEIVQLVLGVPQVWAEMANPPPSTVGLSATRAPVLVTVTDWGGLF